MKKEKYKGNYKYFHLLLQNDSLIHWVKPNKVSQLHKKFPGMLLRVLKAKVVGWLNGFTLVLKDLARIVFDMRKTKKWKLFDYELK